MREGEACCKKDTDEYRNNSWYSHIVLLTLILDLLKECAQGVGIGRIEGNALPEKTHQDADPTLEGKPAWTSTPP